MSNLHVGLLFQSEKQASFKILLLAEIFNYRSYSWKCIILALTVYHHLI